MNLYIRCLWVWLLSLLRPRLKLTESSRLKLMVFPNDLDIYGHMNNGRYLTVMDLGRFDLLLRTGLYRQALSKKWSPIVATSNLKHLKPLNLFEPYELVTTLRGWDDNWVYIEQRFLKSDKTIALGWIRGVMVGQNGRVRSPDLLSAMNYSEPSPALPQGMDDWAALKHKENA